jgi:hypothetical protein
MELLDKPGRIALWLLLISGPALIIIEPKAIGWRLLLLALVAVGTGGLSLESNWVNQRQETFSVIHGDLSSSSRSPIRTVFVIVASIVATVIFGVITWTKREEPKISELHPKTEVDSSPPTANPSVPIGGVPVKSPKLPLPSLPGTKIIPATPPNSSKAPKVKPKPVGPSLKLRAGQLSDELYKWMLDKEGARPEVNYANIPDISPQARNMILAQQVRAQTEYDRQTLLDYHEKFEGRLVVIKDELKTCEYNVESLAGEISGIGAPFTEINWGIILGITNNLSGFYQKLPDKDADLVCKP